ncbi:hypothetical protein MARPO_1384s0001 [Marchantia polymorpha]|uniref:Uncharacterized protein n=1 Tax=Marchantia polymorpha TaxID=3197 RepID=A0A2R6VY00_MARPO|nr:hypothetical protein MARPO_1384s0001 [Marchantia polymorpha]|eukprot:PTQ26489.1 hypothetical protein MARPO_1384s0001 [Marchantia polymorpha]
MSGRDRLLQSLFRSDSRPMTGRMTSLNQRLAPLESLLVSPQQYRNLLLNRSSIFKLLKRLPMNLLNLLLCVKASSESVHRKHSILLKCVCQSVLTATRLRH